MGLAKGKQRDARTEGDGGREIHPTAIIDPGAVLGKNVSVGPYSVIGDGVTIGDGSEIMGHVTLKGPTTLGCDNRIYSHASIGDDPQDKKYDFQSPSALEIGDGNVIREFVTIHRGTRYSRGTTRVGDRNWIMAYCHVAHDCVLGNDLVMANGATLGGHVTVANGATLGGFTAVHPFCAIGEVAVTGGQTMIAQDVPPFVIATGNRVRLYGVNKIGMERQNFSKQEIHNMRVAYKIFFRSKLSAGQALERLEADFPDSSVVATFVNFVKNSSRGICR